MFSHAQIHFYGSNSDEELITKMNDIQWFEKNNINTIELNKIISKSEYLKSVSSDFPFALKERILFENEKNFITQDHFSEWYKSIQRKVEDKFRFVYSDLVKFFLASGFNGAYVFIDDFERIPDFQSARQKKDFALELRTCLYDGISENAKIGFYNFILVCHAGVPNLIQEAWESSGLENRAGISVEIASGHIIRFEKLKLNDPNLLLKKYLKEYRIKNKKPETEIHPFTEEALKKIAELSKFNAAKILKNLYSLLSKAAEKNIPLIDGEFVQKEQNILETQKQESISLESETAISSLENMKK